MDKITECEERLDCKYAKTAIESAGVANLKVKPQNDVDQDRVWILTDKLSF